MRVQKLYWRVSFFAVGVPGYMEYPGMLAHAVIEPSDTIWPLDLERLALVEEHLAGVLEREMNHAPAQIVIMGMLPILADPETVSSSPLNVDVLTETSNAIALVVANQGERRALTNAIQYRKENS